MTEEICEVCNRPKAACVCDRITELATTRRVLILQHPQEQDAVLGSAQIVAAMLPKAKIVVGLSWANLGHALGEEEVDGPRSGSGAPVIDVKRWAAVFPDREAEGEGVFTKKGAALDASALEGIVVLDGTWSKAKTLWWRNPWLTKLSRMSLTPKEPSIYGRLRAEPRRDFVSTLESVGAALTLCGEPPEVEAGLKKVFRTMVQRVRDAKLIPPKPAGRPSKKARLSKPGPVS